MLRFMNISTKATIFKRMLVARGDEKRGNFETISVGRKRFQTN